MKELALTITGPAGATVATPKGIPGNPNIINNVPQFIITALITLVVIASLIMIIYSGIQWITSGGDEKKIEGARGRLTYAIVGLIVAMISVLIVGLTIQLLGGNTNLFGLGFFGATPENGVGAQTEQTGNVQGTGSLPSAGQHCFFVLGQNICR